MSVEETSTGGLYLGETRLFTYATSELSEALERFYSDDARRALGGKALRLITSEHLAVYRTRAGEGDYGGSYAISAARLSEAERALVNRGGIRPIVTTQARARRHVPYNQAPENTHGIELLFTAQLDELTSRALGNIALINQANEIELQLVIPRQSMRKGEFALVEARDGLQQLLVDVETPGSLPVRTDGLHFTRPDK